MNKATLLKETVWSFHCGNCEGLGNPAWFSLDEWGQDEHIFCPRCGLPLKVLYSVPEEDSV